MTKKIKDTLKKLGILPNVKGYHYLVTGVELALIEFQKKQVVQSWTDLYRIIAVRHLNCSSSTVERCIRSAIDTARDMETALFKELIAPYEICNSSFMAIVAEYVLEEQDN